MSVNLCTYEHPKYLCAGRGNKAARRACKFFPSTCDDCTDFNKHGCGDCDCTSAQFETWALHTAALELQKED